MDVRGCRRAVATPGIIRCQHAVSIILRGGPPLLNLATTFMESYIVYSRGLNNRIYERQPLDCFVAIRYSSAKKISS